MTAEQELANQIVKLIKPVVTEYLNLFCVDLTDESMRQSGGNKFDMASDALSDVFLDVQKEIERTW